MNRQEISIRPAVPADVPALARLWLEAFPRKFAHLMGNRAFPVIREWLDVVPEIWEGTWIAQASSEVVGYIQLQSYASRNGLGALWHIARQRLGLARRLFGASRRHLGILGGATCLARLAMTEIRPIQNDELYIEMLGVSAAWRGQSIGSRLLALAEAEARTRGLRRLRLGVVSENEGAIRLYQRFGYAPSPEHRSHIVRWAIGSPAYYWMTKELT